MYKVLDKSLSFLSSKRRQEEHPPSEGFCEPVPGKVSEWELDRCKRVTSVGFYYKTPRRLLLVSYLGVHTFQIFA